MTDTIQPEKMPLTSLDISAEKREQLRLCIAEAFPEVLAEGKIDLEQLRRVLGEWVEPDRERFGLNWPGKAACINVIQAPSVGTLQPCQKESVDWDATQHVFIEGDNLEVLKLLQKSYFGKIKLIYIDPPYNTGQEFIYPDKFSETLETYLQYSNQMDSDGNKFSTNTDYSGRFHSKWLNMMYPRLYLAKNLLSKDGTIFISINEVEIAHLRCLCDQIFGSENFCGQISRATGTRMGVGGSTIASELDYILVYSKSEEAAFVGLPMEDNELGIYDQEDERGKYLLRSLRRTGGENRREDRPSMYYPVEAPDGTQVYPIAPAGYESRWVCSKTTYATLVSTKMIEWKQITKDGKPRWQVYQKHYVGEALKQPSNLWNVEEGNKKATRDLNSLFDEQKAFDHPKPIGLMQKIVALATNAKGGDIVLDFFAGSGTTGHAVIAQNAFDEGNRKFILVQLPERLNADNRTQEVAANICDSIGAPRNVAELSKERMRRASKAIKQDAPLFKGDIGFRIFKLDSSCFKAWNPEALVAGQEETLITRLEEHAGHIRPNISSEDILYELLLKDGFNLNEPIVRQKLAGTEVFSIADGTLLVCLDKQLTQEVIDAMADMEPSRVICLDAGFQGNDQLKANAVQTFKARARNRETAVEFRTV
jgi:adenine-specific DNA-methyltransferase